MTFNFEIPKVKFREDWKLEKFDGEKMPGDGKLPVEVLEGGDGKPTILTQQDGTQIIVKEAEPLLPDPR